MNEKWQTVPVEPTQEMIAAAEQLPETFSLGDEWRVMIDAAPKQQEQAPADRDGLIRRLRAVCETGCDPDLPFEAADEIALRRRLLREQMQLTNQRTEEILRLTAERDGLLALLKEARLTFEMWKDVAPAFSLCADIDSAIAKVEKGGV